MAPPVLIVGIGHSGTTILYRMLAMHPDVTWLSQYSLRDGSIPGRRTMPFHHRIDSALRSRWPHDWRKGGGTGVDRLRPAPKEGSQVWDHVFSGRPKASATLLRDVIDEQLRLWGKSTFLGKWIRFHRLMPIIQAAWPDATIIHSLRDGRAVALSHRHKTRKLQTRDPLEALEQAAERWLQIRETMSQMETIMNVVELRYEDFCADVHAQLERALLASGLPIGTFPFARCPARLEVTNERRLAQATTEELALLDRILGTVEGAGPGATKGTE